MNHREVTAEEFLAHAAASPRGAFSFAGIDVRSEGEFAEGGLPGFVNHPILNDGERHQVGLAYKTEGQVPAIALGQSLVAGAVREARVDLWRQAVRGTSPGTAYVSCWRGGLRSRIACQWISEAGGDVAQIAGGYKAVRRALMGSFLADPASTVLPEFRVLSGLTGAGKTELLVGLARDGAAVIDLEGHARHRGSSFGLRLGDRQPAQATFENAVAWDYDRLRRAGRHEIWVEDESRCIGRNVLPALLKGSLEKAGVVILEASVAERARRIHREYIGDALRDGAAPDKLGEALANSVHAIRKKLGGMVTAEILKTLQVAFAERDFSLERHEDWIQKLLVHYYDKAYRSSFELHPRPVLFQGDETACRQWILQRSG